MASIKKRDNGKWRARYRDAAGKEHARHFDRKTDAQRWLDQVTAAVVRGDYVDPKAGRVTLASYAGAWERIQVSSDGTKRIVDNALRLHILPELGAQPLATIRPSAIQGLVKRLEAKDLSPGTIGGIYHVLTQVMTAAVDDRLISSTPCRRIRLPKTDAGEVVPPTVEQVTALADAISDRWRAVVVTLAGSGLRIGELLGLSVSDIDFLRREIRVERQRSQAGALVPVKSKSSRRTVPVGEVVIDELAAHLAAFPSAGALFVDEIGDPLLYRRWKTISGAGVKEANTRAAAALRAREPKSVHVSWEFTAHDLRHFYASALIAGGASVKQVQQRLGHASAVITLQTYAHLWPGDDDRTRDVIDAALAPLAPRQSERRAAR
jgi:integrase